MESLPTETVMGIFSHCCSERYPLHASIPLRLSHVCAAWRALALSMPTLWASFSINIGDDELLHLHLERSAQCPLSFDANFGKKNPSPAALDLVAALAQHSDRWSHAKLPFWSDFAPITFARLRGRLGRLESLDLRIHGWVDQRDGANSTYFEDAPRLRRLALGASLSREMPFPPNQLTFLHLGAGPTMEFLHFLALCPCPHLTTLILNPHYPTKLPGTPQPLPPLVYLHTLILAIRDGYSRNPIIDVLDPLTTPSLSTLRNRRAFTSFLERSGCTLRTLAVAFRDTLPFSAVQSNLQLLPSLTHLIFFARGKKGTIVDLLLQSLTTTSLLPNLTSLELKAARFHPAVVDFAASRLSAEEAAHRERLESFRDQGLVVSYLPRYKPSRSALLI
ncbi:hypothetical protein B0H14DRAFT_2661365 [Mycena olivaceomarginata]|nr:hypothetical protein B0H14DRAFT_2661365 [Mycena olivaceomarginata]